METKTRTTVSFLGDTVRQFGLTEIAVRALFADGEWPIDVTTEANWMGLPMIMVSLTTDQDDDGDASQAEFEDCAAACGYRTTTSYVGLSE